ncbi:MAG: alpha/beta fold hydrolase [Chthoniobacterales bacterium]|nr:alpha/beta fold hydrolase [Chthoniobacterales bacterium]
MSLPAKIKNLFPPRPKVAPALRVLRRTRIKGGERREIEYAVEKGERVRAYLLVPDGTGRRPGILASHQHAGQHHLGKSEPVGLAGDREMAYGLELFQRGFVVLCPDHLGFEDRRQRRLRGQQNLQGASYEHFLFLDALLRGRSLAAKYLFDLQQAVDVLAALDCVDASRLGGIGHSLGGQTILWLAAADPRMKAVFSSCGFSQIRSIQEKAFLHNRAMYLPGFLEVGDMDDVVAAIAPRALGMSHGTRDLMFPLSGVREIHRRAKATFAPDKLLPLIFRGGHSFSATMRRKAYGFIESHLLPR